MAGNIFINYRRGDDPGFTQALYSRLEQVFPIERLFMDVDNIAPGLDFVQVLNDQVARCDVLIAVIGKSWLAAPDETGARRLDNPEDFVRIEIESALQQKKRVIPVLVNDAKMPRSNELPESLKAFARCNAVRLSHERFRADTAGLIKALEDVLAELDAARKAESEEAQLKAEAREKAEAERLRQERLEARKLRAATPDMHGAETRHPASFTGVLRAIAELPSGINWSIPIALLALTFLGWSMPFRVFKPVEQGGFGWGLSSLVYGVGGLMALGVLLRLRRQAMGGAELALYWFALVCFGGVTFFSLYNLSTGSLPPYWPIATLALITAASLIALRRSEIGGLEFAVYWFGITLFLFSALIVSVTWTFGASDLGAALHVEPYPAAGILLAGVIILSGLAILAWRNRRMSMPELAIYLLGLAYWVFVAARFAQT
jgi:hypothetical protein